MASCRECKRPVDRLKRRPVERWLSRFVPVRPFFCRACRKRQWRYAP